MNNRIPDDQIPDTDPNKLVIAYKKWVWYIIRKYYRIIVQGRGYIDEEDLFQAGIMGLLAAQERYDPEAGSFLHYSQYYIRNYIRMELGIRNGEPLQPAPLSLDAPASNNPDMDNITLGDTIPDEDSETPEEYAARTYESQELHKAVDRLKNEKKREIIERVYFREQSRQQAAIEMGIDSKVLSETERVTIRLLRKDHRLRNAIAPDHHVGVSRFNTTMTSEVEEKILWMERHIDRQFGDGTYISM